MILSDTEKIILLNIGYDKYSDLSIDASKTDEFASLHFCVNIARNEIKRYCFIPATYVVGGTIVTTAANAVYSLPADFDLPVKMFYMTIASEIIELKKWSAQKVGNLLLTDTGTPSNYIILGTSGGFIQIYLLITPANTGEVILPIYKPVLTALSLATAEDIIMKKYPETVIKIATAWAFQFLKKDDKNFVAWQQLGFGDFKNINLRENSADDNPILNIDELLATIRIGRNTV